MTLIDSHQLENIKLIRRELETRKKNTERPPLIVIPVHVFQTAFSLINWGKWLRTSSPGPVPYCPFLFSLPHPPLFPAPTVLDSPYSPPVLSRPCFTLRTPVNSIRLFPLAIVTVSITSDYDDGRLGSSLSLSLHYDYVTYEPLSVIPLFILYIPFPPPYYLLYIPLFPFCP